MVVSAEGRLSNIKATTQLLMVGSSVTGASSSPSLVFRTLRRNILVRHAKEMRGVSWRTEELS